LLIGLSTNSDEDFQKKLRAPCRGSPPTGSPCRAATVDAPPGPTAAFTLRAAAIAPHVRWHRQPTQPGLEPHTDRWALPPLPGRQARSCSAAPAQPQPMHHRANHCPVRKLKAAPVADPTIGEKAGSERTWLKVVQAVKAVRLFGGPKAM